MDNSQLQQLITEICQLPEYSQMRRRLMTELISQLQNHPGLIKSRHPDYLDVLVETYEWLIKNICNSDRFIYTDMKRLLKFINQRIKWKMLELYRLEKKIDLDVDVEQIPARDISGLDAYIEEINAQRTQEIASRLENYIKQDPDRILRSVHPRFHPACNCQLLAIKRILKIPPDRFNELAKELNVPFGTMTAHWHRKCLPLLQQIAKELGYQPDEDY